MKADFRNWDLYIESSSHVLLCACSPLLKKCPLTTRKVHTGSFLGPWSVLSRFSTWLLSLESYWITAGPEHIQLCPHCLSMSSVWEMRLLCAAMTESRVTLDIHCHVVMVFGTGVPLPSFQARRTLVLQWVFAEQHWPVVETRSLCRKEECLYTLASPSLTKFHLTVGYKIQI